MNPDSPAEDTGGNDPAGDDKKWWESHPHTTTRAVPVTEQTAGVDVTRIDFSELDEPPYIQLEEYYPPEDDVDGDSITLHGPGEALELAATLIGLVGQEFEIPTLADDELEDDEWTPSLETGRPGGDDR